jgi:hypothetical protein
MEFLDGKRQGKEEKVFRRKGVRIVGAKEV